MRSTRRAALGSAFLATAAAATLGVARPARAQMSAGTPGTATAAPATPPDEDYHRPGEFGLIGGVHLFTADHGLGRAEGDPEDKSPAHSATFGLRGGFGSPHLWLEAEFLATPTHTRNDMTQEWIFSYRGDFVIDFIGSGSFRPFLLLGYGAMSSTPADQSQVKADTDGVFDVGLGTKILILPGIGLRLDGRLLVPPALLAEKTNVRVGDETHYGGPDVEVLASIYFAFGGEPPAPPPAPLPPPPPPRRVVVRQPVPVPMPPADPDGDGIAGNLDACPMIAEDRDGFEDSDGCPDPDNDRDGLPDPRDRCPDQAGPGENQGCPDADRDGDGIVDRLDRCPAEPEDKDLFQDEDGCPDPDNDADGILDALDKCPAQPETRNNFQDQDGCPDELPPEVKKFTGVIEGINFKTGSAQITAGSHGILDRAARVLGDYPDVRIEISGHTDSRGKADYNRDLSARRAQSVKDYLIGKGIKEDRMTTIGYGPDRPIASNGTDSGRAQNRRTEFRLIGAP